MPRSDDFSYVKTPFMPEHQEVLRRLKDEARARGYRFVGDLLAAIVIERDQLLQRAETGVEILIPQTLQELILSRMLSSHQVVRAPATESSSVEADPRANAAKAAAQWSLD